MNVDAPTRCEQCSAPIRQTKTGRRRRYCGGACRKAAYRVRTEAWTCMEAADPQLAALPTLEDLYASEHADDFDLKAWWADCEARGIVPPKRDRQGLEPRAGRTATPSPENSTVTDVAATIRAAQAIAAELRRHGLAAEGLVAVKCAAVASALDAALAAQFVGIL